MKNILVVDDEAIQRRVLSSMIRNVRPECTVIEASNGKKALEVIDSHSIDVVVTDIKMPMMDGFDFIERSNERKQQLKIIILSGYRYFEYAQKALRLGAFDYLLKPVKEESIVQMLENVEASIRKDNSLHLEKEQLSKQLDTTLPVYYEHMFNDWISGGLTIPRLRELKAAFSLRDAGTVIVSHIHSGKAQNGPDRTEQMRLSMIDMLNGSLKAAGEPVSFFSLEDKSKLVTVLTKEPHLEGAYGITDQLLAFLWQVRERYGLEVTIGVGCERENIGNDAAGSYEEALAAASYRFFIPTEPVIYYAGLPRPLQQMSYELSKEEEALKELIKQMKSDAFVRYMHGIFDNIVETGCPFPHQLKKTFVHLTYNMAAVIKDFAEEEQYNRLVSDMEHRINECSEFEQFKGRIIEYGLQFISLFQTARSRKHELVMEKCIAYIHAHYMEELSLESVASLFYFSPNYLSMVFKNHLGTTFIKYLCNVRLSKAVELLEYSELKVYEIAARTGFKDDKYFYRVFKRKFGITPDEYRRNIIVQPAGKV